MDDAQWVSVVTFGFELGQVVRDTPNLRSNIRRRPASSDSFHQDPPTLRRKTSVSVHDEPPFV